MTNQRRGLIPRFLILAIMVSAPVAGQLGDLIFEDGFDSGDTSAWTNSPPPDPGALDDEFDNAATLGQWRRIYQVEQWGVDHLEVLDVDTTQAGRMVMVPHPSGWFRDRRTTMAYKEVTGDFVISTEVHVDDRNPLDADRIPEAQFSLAGLMIRTPRNVTPATWTPGGENYVFLSLGNGNTSGPSSDFQFEVKTTTDSNSVLVIDTAGVSNAEIQIARIGEAVITLRKLPGENWEVHRRYRRPDFPARLQAGFVAYTDWDTVSSVSTEVHNTTVLVGSPDLVAGFEYARFASPEVPPALAGRDLADPFDVSDTDLLTFLGDIPAAP